MLLLYYRLVDCSIFLDTWLTFELVRGFRRSLDGIVGIASGHELDDLGVGV
jgi:hypothetical protein